MQVGNLINDIVPQVEKRKRVDDLRCVVKNTLSDDGRFVNQMEIVPVDTENDLRNFFRADDFSLSTVLANDGASSLRECPKIQADILESIDNMDDALNAVSHLRETETMLNNDTNVLTNE